jgi:hypothetical protein
MAKDRSDDAPVKATEMGPIFWISIGLGTVASLPLLSGIANGTITIVRGVMWFLVTTLVAMVGVWTISWLAHVFTDPYPDDGVEEDGASAATEDAPATSASAPSERPAATDDDDVDASPAMSDAP